jgi:methylenetetrahydrofolate--tRNA-(uracil-5-)-methyltransferase
MESLIMQTADATRVPAGSALAVDRQSFAWQMTSCLLQHPRLRLQRREVTALPPTPCILASGPLTSLGLHRHLGRILENQLYFYDAIAPIVEASSIDWTRVFRGARRDALSEDYVNCPMNREQYDTFVHALRHAIKVLPHRFEEPRYFEGCLPIEVMAARGDDVLAHGPLRPVGLVDPRSGKRPYAVLQLRAENQEGSCFNLVGFQTRLLQKEQRRVFRLIPGLEQATFLRYGSIHRNAYLDAPRVLGPELQLKRLPHVTVAGQLSGVEGYLESVAIGLLAGLFRAAEKKGWVLEPPPRTTALGALLHHLIRQRATAEPFTPSNITFGLLPAEAQPLRQRRMRRLAIAERAARDLTPWLEQVQRMVSFT